MLPVEKLWLFAIFISIIIILVLNKLYSLRNLLNPFNYSFLYYYIFNFLTLCIPYHYNLLKNPSEVFFGNLLLILSYGIGGSVYYLNNKEFFDRDNVCRGNYLFLKKDKIVFSETVPVLFLLGVFNVFFHYFFIAGGIPIIHPHRESFRVVSIMGKGQVLKIGLTAVFVSTIIYIIRYMWTNRKRYLFVVVIGFIILITPGYRQLVYQAAVVLYIVSIYKRRKHYTYVTLMILFVAGLISLGLLGVYRWGDYGVYLIRNARIKDILFWTLSRPAANNWGFDYVISAFGRNTDFLHGKSFIMDIITVLPGYQPSFGLWLKDFFGLTYEGGSLMVGQQGVYYSNFGWLGISILGFINSILLLSIYKYFRNRLSMKRFIYLVIISVTFVDIASVQGIIYQTMMMLTVVYFVDLANKVVYKKNREVELCKSVKWTPQSMM